MIVSKRYGCLFLLLTVLALPVAAAPAVFAVKPEWWDATSPRLPLVAQLKDPAVAWTLLEAANDFWQKPLEGWRVAGPFDGAQGRGMDAVLPPEKGVSKAAMPGKGGMPVEWQEWRAGQPCPLTAEMKDAIVFAFRTLRVEAPTHTWLVVEGSGRCKVWVDGKPAAEGSAGETSATAFDFLPGAHQILIKLEVPAGKWSFRAALASYLPEQLEIRCRTMIVQRWPDDAAAVERHGIELARLYARLEDASNFRFWVLRVLAPQKDPAHFAAVSASWDAVVSRRPGMALALNAVLRDCFLSARDNPPIRDALGASMLKTMTWDDMESDVRAFRTAGYQPPPQQAAQFLTLCVLSNRLASLPYWVEQYVLRESEPRAVAEFLRPLMAKAGDVARQELYNGMEGALLVLPPSTCAPLIKFYAETALARGDSDRVDRLLDLQDGMARRVLPFEAAMWDLDVARAELDQDRARAALATAALAKPAYVNSPEYDRTRAEIFKMRAGTARPGAILNDPDDAVQTLARYARQNETGRLNGYIRRMLAERGHFLVADANDNNLFTSAKAVYRGLFAEYAATYNPFLAREVADLAAKPGMTAEAERLQRLAALTPPASSAAPPAAPLRVLSQVAAPQGVFGGQFELPAGMSEACGEETRTSFLGAWQPVLSGSGTDLDGLLVVQNSRGVVALANGVPCWSYVAALNPGQCNHFSMGYGGLCRPARAGAIVAVRLETSGGRFELIGFDARSGVIRWRWRGAAAAEEPAGSPATWRDASFLVPVLRAGAEESELSLAVIEAATGRETCRLPLAAATRASIGSAACGNGLLCQHRTLAAPTVVGDSAYVDTGLGMVCALDLQDESVRWARLYQRKFNDVGGGMRTPVAPIVGSRNVLFAPVDSRWVMLVDRTTGVLVQRRTDLAWTSIGRCGAENVLVTTPSALQLLPLAGTGGGKVVDQERMLHVAALADGCVLAGNSELAVMNSQGQTVRSMKIPADVVPVCLDAEGRWWGWGGVDGCAWGRLDDTTARKPSPLPAVAVGAGPMAPPNGYANPLYETTWLPAAAGAYRIGQNLLTRVNADSSPRWELPLPSDCFALAGGRRFIAGIRRRVWTFDDADGSVCSVWPPLTGATNALSALRISTHGSSVYAAAATAAKNGTRIWDLGVDGREPPAPLVDLPYPPGNDFWVTTVSTQVFVVMRAANDSDVRLFRAFRPETPRTAPPADATQEAQWSRQFNATVWYDRMRRNAVIFCRNPAETVRFNYDGMARHTIKGLSELWNGTAVGWGELMVFHYTQDAFVRVTEPLEGGSVVLRERPDDKQNLPPWPFTGRIGAEIFGMRRIDANKLMVYRQDLARATDANDASQKAVLTGPAPGPADAWRGVVALGDGRILMLASSKTVREEQMHGYIWTPGSETLDTVLLPNATQPVQPLSSNLWACGDALFTPADWARGVAPGAIRRVTWTNNYAGADSFAADGFLDEWKDEEFMPMPQGRLAIRRPTGRGEGFRVAVDITNSAAVAAMAAASDLLSACRVWAGRADAAGLDIPRTQVLPLSNENVMGPNRPVRRCAWQVTPDGRRSTLEFELMLPGVPARNAGEPPPERALQLGDLALRITLDDPLAGSVDLVGNSRAGALGFVRLLLP
jgi:hypothetical protein